MALTFVLTVLLLVFSSFQEAALLLTMFPIGIALAVIVFFQIVTYCFLVRRSFCLSSGFLTVSVCFACIGESYTTDSLADE